MVAALETKNEEKPEKVNIQVFERMGNVAVALVGTDSQPENEYARKIIHFKPRKQLTRQEYLREIGISYAVSAGEGDPIEWDLEVDKSGNVVQ